MRSMRLARLLPLAIVLVAASSYADLQISKGALEDAFFSFVTEGSLTPPTVGPTVKALAVAQRAEMVRSCCTQAKTYFASDRFKSRYQAWRKERQPVQPKPKTVADMKAEQAASRAKSREDAAQMEASIKSLPVEMQAEMRKTMAQVQQELAKIPQATDAELARFAEAEAQSAREQHQRDLASAPSADPKVRLNASLKQFLEATDGIDYAAATMATSHLKRFTNATYEGKSGAWKMGYRAGREATEAARTFARQWLGELK